MKNNYNSFPASYLPTPRSAATSTIFCLTFSAALISTLLSSSSSSESGNSGKHTAIPPCPGQEARKRKAEEMDTPPQFSLYNHIKMLTGFGSSSKHDFIREN